MTRTDYAEVTDTDTDVATFITQHLDSVNLYHLPIKMWVARHDGTIIALLMLKTDPYVSIDLIVADPDSRPFMRILRLWQIAEVWLIEHNVPIVATSIHNSRAHFQDLVKRAGFEVVGSEADNDGKIVETIFAKALHKAKLPLSKTVH